jgi:Fe-S cluster biogenesis protein NfuA
MNNKEIIEKIKNILEVEVSPHLENDGGGVEFVDFDDKEGVLSVKLQGACVGCPMRQMTLENGIGSVIKGQIPEVKEVIAV